MHRKEEYIAVFDSGLGGISVLRELMRLMPGEKYLYFGDSANAPYGNRSTAKVRELTITAAENLLSRGVKALVVACNTATAAAINDLRARHPDTIIIGIEPAVKLAADRCKGGHVAVMATAVTLREEKFNHLLERFPHLQVTPICPGELVSLIEKGATEEELEDYLRPILAPFVGKLSAVVLGCTHYPFAASAIRKILGENVEILDGGVGTAQQTKRRLEEQGLLYEGPGQIQIENSDLDPRMVLRAAELLHKE